MYCSPVVSEQADTLVVLEFPNLPSCEGQNPWRHPGAQFLSRAFSHACGGDLRRFHLTYLMKCHGRIDGMTPPVRKRRDWAQACAAQYLHRELSEIRPKQILLFGEMSARVCFPNQDKSWDELKFSEAQLAPYDIRTVFFDGPNVFQRQGLSSDDGYAFLERLHGILGGNFSPPDRAESSNLFELL
jgi:uracil-DNA glycosylase